MEPVPVHTTTEEAYRQLLFIDNFLVTFINKKNLRSSLVGLFFTVVTLLIFFFTNHDFGVVGIVMLPLLWGSFGIYLLYLKWKTYRRRTGVLKELADAIIAELDPNTKFHFTDEEVTIIQKENTVTLNWDKFRAYLEDDDTIYLFQENLYLPWSFSKYEVDAAIVEQLKEMARKKLPLLSFPAYLTPSPAPHQSAHTP